MADILARTIAISGAPDGNICTWESDIEIAGVAYVGSRLVRISEIQMSSTNRDATRTQVVLSLSEHATFEHFAVDRGPSDTVLGWALSQDDGVTWRALRRSFDCKVSLTVIEDGLLSIEFENLYGDVLHDETKMYSHEDQEREYENDLGLEHLRTLSTSAGLQLGWPRVWASPRD